MKYMILSAAAAVSLVGFVGQASAQTVVVSPPAYGYYTVNPREPGYPAYYNYDRNRDPNYYVRDADRLPTGTVRWWDQMERESRTGTGG
jgi:hypothetical protein